MVCNLLNFYSCFEGNFIRVSNFENDFSNMTGYLLKAFLRNKKTKNIIWKEGDIFSSFVESQFTLTTVRFDDSNNLSKLDIICFMRWALCEEFQEIIELHPFIWFLSFFIYKEISRPHVVTIIIISVSLKLCLTSPHNQKLLSLAFKICLSLPSL